MSTFLADERQVVAMHQRRVLVDQHQEVTMSSVLKDTTAASVGHDTPARYRAVLCGLVRHRRQVSCSAPGQQIVYGSEQSTLSEMASWSHAQFRTTVSGTQAGTVQTVRFAPLADHLCLPITFDHSTRNKMSKASHDSSASTKSFIGGLDRAECIHRW
jgi:hypothetical protein